MFKHHATGVSAENDLKSKPPSVVEKMHHTSAPPTPTAPESKSDSASVRELLEKNLKWSQIIYEQNRKINHKLLWMSIMGWLRVMVIVVPLVLAFIYLSPFLRSAMDTYGKLLNVSTNPVSSSKPSSEEIIKLLPLNDAEREQLKAILK